MPDTEGSLKQDVRAVQQRLSELQDELKSGLGSLSGEQAALRRRAKRLDDTAQEAGEKQSALEQRIGALEREHDATITRNTNSFEALSTRLMEVGVELASWPPAAEVQAALEVLEGLAADSNQLAPEEAELEATLSLSLKQCRSGFGYKLGELEGTVRQYRAELDASPKQLRSEWEALARQCQVKTESCARALVEQCKTEFQSSLEQGLRQINEQCKSQFRSALDLNAKQHELTMEHCKSGLESALQRCKELEWMVRECSKDCKAAQQTTMEALVERLEREQSELQGLLERSQQGQRGLERLGAHVEELRKQVEQVGERVRTSQTELERVGARSEESRRELDRSSAQVKEFQRVLDIASGRMEECFRETEHAGRRVKDIGQSVSALEAGLGECRQHCLSECRTLITHMTGECREECVGLTRSVEARCRQECTELAKCAGGEWQQICQRDLEVVTRHVFGSSGTRACSSPGEPVASEAVCLEGRMAGAEQQLERLFADVGDVLQALANKAELEHTHDRLVSTDGSITFAL